VLPWTLGLSQTEALDKLRDAHGDDYPALTVLAAADTSPAHSAFEFGLERILDGLELLITFRRP
jgi:Tetracyclin repressor-like, C-terminal domain